MTSYRVICSLSPFWNRIPTNRYSEAAAKKALIKWNKICPGEHSIELIKE